MEFCENWEDIQKRFLQFWARENHDLPLMHITAPRDHAEPAPVSGHATLRDRWMDTEYQIKKANWWFQNNLYLGEAVPTFNPDLGPDFFSTAFGTQIIFAEHTSWSEHFLTEDMIEEYTGLNIDMANEYYRKMDELTSAGVEDGKDRYLVGITDLHPGADGLMSLRGSQPLCYDTLEYQDFIRRVVMDMNPVFNEIYEHLYKLTTKYQKGSTCWMPLWHPERWYVPSCDFSIMISDDMYKDLFLDEIREEISFLDGSVYHLDGPGALRHLDTLLQIPNLDGIQWVYGAGQPTASHWLEVVRKIQAAGKCCQIDVVPSELETMLQELSPEGLHYTIRCKNEEEARDMLKLAEKYKR